MLEKVTKEQRIFIVEQYFKNNEDFSNKIIFSDETHFYHELVNRQNCCIWDLENSWIFNYIAENLIIVKKFTSMYHFMLCEFWTGSIIESFFFENAADRIIVNGIRYRDMIIQFLCLNYIIYIYNLYKFIFI